ncbi:MAG TPA: putative glycolipid-binding domain-containing protein [Pseudorhizobium sp.]|nr:putative glycolipid-binding domain-containing protein [Pseudorhizobium sp.]
MGTLATAFWRRLDVPGHDAASVRELEDGCELSGQSTFLDPRGPTALRYVLTLDGNWVTRAGRITGFIDDRAIDDHIVRSASGWRINGRAVGMGDILDLDLGFTPATNMVQLRRVSLAIGASTSFDFAWHEAGGEELQRLPQEYRRASDYDYPYCFRSPCLKLPPS